MAKKPILIIQNVAAEGPGTILDWLADRALPYTLVHTYRGQALPDLGSIEATISLGCPHSAARYHEHDYLASLFAWLSKAVREDQPYLGICFGGQLLANVLGTRVEQRNVTEIGTYRASLTEQGAADPLFTGFDQTFPIFHWHHDTFRTPFNGIHLASDGVWKHQAFRKDRQVGLQFHLEVRREDVERWCDSYGDELTSFGKAKDEILTDFDAVAEELRRTNYRLLDNWLG